jgi:hypothetical protein
MRYSLWRINMRTEKQAQEDLETATDAARHVTIVTGTRLRKDALQVIGEVSTVAALDAVYAAMDDQGGIALDVTDVYGRPALYVKLRHEVERGKQADTMATHAVAVKRAADRKHKRTSASYDPRPTMAGRSTYYGTARRPWTGAEMTIANVLAYARELGSCAVRGVEARLE